MRIWLVTIGEPLPTDEGARLLRTGLLAEMLADRGHDVVWWTSTFDHRRRRHRSPGDVVTMLRPNLRLVALRGLGYRRSVSIARVVDHHQLKAKFAKRAAQEASPDVVLCSLPTVDLCTAAVEFGKKRRVPVVLDVRDLWPDIFAELAPRWARGAARVALAPWFGSLRRACAAATAIVGITEPFVDWGVAHAGRRRRALDRSFPLAYRASTPGEHALVAARAYWSSRGIHPGGGDFVACFFGTIGRQFDLETVIRGARQIPRGGRRVRIVICGTGERLESYRAMAAEMQTRRHEAAEDVAVDFPGWVDRAQIASLMELGSVGLAPYLGGMGFEQSYPNKVIEYLSAGLPVVSCLGGLVHDLIVESDCGASYPSGDSAAFASALGALRDDPARCNRMRRNAACVFRERFVAERVYGEMIGHLELLAESVRGVAPPHEYLVSR
jgi:glycosyltransferase involved in cell wall biosynthesis